MQQVELIEAAKAIAGSYTNVANEIGSSPQKIRDWKNGVSCPLEDQALMAALVGLNPIEQIVEAMLERNADKPRGPKLKAALKQQKRR